MKKQAGQITYELSKGIISETKACERATSVNVAVAIAKTLRFKIKLWHAGTQVEP